MQCRETESLVMKYLDGNISELEMEKLLKHNEGCSQCALEFEILRDAIYTIEELPDLEVPEDFNLKVMTKIKEQKQYELSKNAILSWFIGMVGLAAFMLNIFYYVLIPAIKNSSAFTALYNNLVISGNWLVNAAKEVFLLFTVTMSKLLIVRNTLLKEYLIFIMVCGVIFIMANILLIKTLKVQSKNT